MRFQVRVLRHDAVCYTPHEAHRQTVHREEWLCELEAKQASLSDSAKKPHTKLACTLRSSARYGRLLKETRRADGRRHSVGL